MHLPLYSLTITKKLTYSPAIVENFDAALSEIGIAD